MRRFVLLLLAVLIALFLILVWVATDPTFIVRGDDNLVTNPNFDTPERGFSGWNVAGCATYVRPPKEGGFKAGPVTFDGGCLSGQSGVISQTIQLSGTNVLAYTHREILKGVGNHIIVTVSDGNGWQWVARDTTTQNGCFCYTSPVTATLPMSTTQVILEIKAVYQAGIGNKITAVTLTGN
jgi:hypothetical protein